MATVQEPNLQDVQATIKTLADGEIAKELKSKIRNPPLSGQCLAEFIGTFIVILVGNGAGAAASLANQLDGWGVAMMWGLAVTFAIYVGASVSGAHYNPAVTITMAVFRGFPKKHILPFILSQIAGAYTASACLYLFWRSFIMQTAAKLGLEIGGAGSQKLMSIFSCFYPSPGVGTDAAAWAMMSTSQAFFIEVVLTAFLLLMIFALTEPDCPGLPQSGLGPLFIGLTVTAIVGIGGSLTMDAVNPVRDFGPRLFAYTVGFGAIAFPGPRGNEWWLYIVAPIIGGLVGAVIYRFGVLKFIPRSQQA